MNHRPISKLWHRFQQFGGFPLIGAYFRMGLGGALVRQGWRLLCRRTDADHAYTAIRHEANKRLTAQYAPYIAERKRHYDALTLDQHRSNKVWTCWLQGFSHAPHMVQVCQESMRRLLTDRDIIQVDADNYRQYATLPDLITKRYERGQMPQALFSDLLRLQLLINHGGTWMDASMLCTGYEAQRKLFDCDLFMFQHFRKNDRQFEIASNWFITACTNNRLLLVLRDVLTEYWRTHTVTLNYYMFHDFFKAVAALYPDETAAMPRKNRLLPLLLAPQLGKPYNAQWMADLTTRCCFHKLNYRVGQALENTRGTFYSVLFKEEG